jgi:hypothetical protein
MNTTYGSTNQNPKAEVALAGQCHYVKELHFLPVIPAHVAHPEKRDRNLLKIRTGFFLLDRLLLTIRRSRAEHGMTALNNIRT